MVTEREPGLRGRQLRRAALTAMLVTDRSLTVGEVLAWIEARGLRVAAAYPRKAVADALGYECSRGWAVRVRRGTYAVGQFSRSTRWRLLNQFG
jgi:hypothetical protein